MVVNNNRSDFKSSWLDNLYNIFFVPLNFPLPQPSNAYSSLEDFGKAIGLDRRLQKANEYNDIIKYDNSRSRLFKKNLISSFRIGFLMVCVFIVYSPLILLLIVACLLVYSLVSSNSFSFVFYFTVIYTISFIIITKQYETIIKQILDDFYLNSVDSFCVRELIYIEFELNNSDSWFKIENREMLNQRMQRLADLTRLLGKRFSKKDKENKRHYEIIAFYLETKANKLLRSHEDVLKNLNNLRNEFNNHITQYYVERQYGLAYCYVTTQNSYLQNYMVDVDKKKFKYKQTIKIVPIALWIFIFLLLLIALIDSSRLPLLPNNNFTKTLIAVCFCFWVTIGAFIFEVVKEYLEPLKALINLDLVNFLKK